MLTSARLFIVVQAALLFCAASSADGRTAGIIGYSGKSGGLFCGNGGFGCHAMEVGAEPPLVRIEGPTEVDPDTDVNYRFVLTSQAPEVQIQAGFNVAASGGTLIVVSGQQAKLQNGELTHTGPKDIDENDEAAWEFTWRTPATPGEYMLFGAGNSVDASTTVEGDAAALTMLVVGVGVVPSTPSATVGVRTPTPTPDEPACAGDCNGSGNVSVGELITGVNISLGSASVETCRACDTDDNGRVTIGELIAAVNNALNGC